MRYPEILILIVLSQSAIAQLPSITEDQLLVENNYTASFGNDVKPAGDVNGDGYTDLIVGEWSYNGNRGAVYVYHGSENGYDSQSDWSYTTSSAQAKLGCSVSSAGDINGDGYDDIIVGAYSWGVVGRVLVFLGGPLGLPQQPDWIKTGSLLFSQQGSWMGWSVADAGDVNKDGYDDILFSEPWAYGGSRFKGGHTWLYYGDSLGVSSDSVLIEGINNSSMFLGNDVSGAGDVNGDGYDDIIIGSPGYNGNSSSNDVGLVQVHYGRASGITSTPDWTYVGTIGFERAGTFVSRLGDVNGDGFSDIISSGRIDKKRQVIHLGSVNGLETNISWNLDITNYPHSENRIATYLGDVNRDGFDDVLAATKHPQAYVFFGSSSGVSSDYNLVISNTLNEPFGRGDLSLPISAYGLADANSDGFQDFAVASPELSINQTNAGGVFLYNGKYFNVLLDSANWFSEGDMDDAQYGHKVANAGDVNNDGWDDLLVSAWQYSNGHFYEGAAFLYLGNNQGVADTAIWVAEGNQHNAFFGYSIGEAGDVNNDDYGDVIIGAMGYDDGQSNTGRFYIYHGGPNGLSQSPDLIVGSDQANAWLGVDVATAGDVNNDGFDDVIIGAYLYDDSLSNDGRSYVYYGSSSGIDPSGFTTLSKYQPNSWFGFSVSKAGDINKDGYGDVIVGSPKYDNGEQDEGAVFVYLGSGTGVLKTPSWSFESDQFNALLGYDVTGSGDNNNDTYDDIVVSAFGYDGTGGNYEGRLFGFHGDSAGLSSQPDFIAVAFGKLNALGKSLSYADDINRDGYDDLIAGAESTDGQKGAVALYLGSSIGLDSIPRWVEFGNQTGSKFGASVSYAGDLNNDYLPDLVVGAPTYSRGHTNEGLAIVYLGEDTIQFWARPAIQEEQALEVANRALIMYPNPASNQIAVPIGSSPIRKVEAITVEGKVLNIPLPIADDISNEYTLDITNLPKGILIFKLVYDERISMFRVLKR